jgi:heavy metal efflux system protein
LSCSSFWETGALPWWWLSPFRKSFPEVRSVVTKLGRPDLATEAMGVYESDTYLTFIPEMQIASAKHKEEFSNRLRKKLESIPGVSYEFS